MTMRLAHDDIFLRAEGMTVRMVPSLRAAYRLQRKHGLTRLMQGIDEGRLEIIRDIADECGDPITADKIIDRLFAGGFGRALASIQQPFAEFLAACYGVDDDQNAKHHSEAREQAGLGFNLTEALEDFFEIGTGWLGWTPEAVWQSTPAEILAAQRGLMAKLKAIHGSAEDNAGNTDHAARAYDPREEVSPEQVRAGLAKLKAEAGRGKQ